MPGLVWVGDIPIGISGSDMVLSSGLGPGWAPLRRLFQNGVPKLTLWACNSTKAVVWLLLQVPGRFLPMPSGRRAPLTRFVALPWPFKGLWRLHIIQCSTCTLEGNVTLDGHAWFVARLVSAVTGLPAGRPLSPLSPGCNLLSHPFGGPNPHFQTCAIGVQIHQESSRWVDKYHPTVQRTANL